MIAFAEYLKDNGWVEFIQDSRKEINGYPMLRRTEKTDIISSVGTISFYYTNDQNLIKAIDNKENNKIIMDNDCFVISVGLYEFGKPPTLSYPRIMLTDREKHPRGYKYWNVSDNATIDRILASHSNDSILNILTNNIPLYSDTFEFAI